MSSTSLKRSAVVNDAIRDRVRETPSRQTSEQNTVQSNPLFKILMSESDPVAKKQEFVTFMTATLDRDQDRARIKAYEEWREWLSHQNTALAQQIIELTNTQTFASLQKIIENMNDGLMNFDDDLKPLMEIVDAIYQLRTSGQFDQAYREIDEDRKADEDRDRRLAETVAQQAQIEQELVNTRLRNAELGQKRGFFGFGGVTEQSRQEIARNEQIALDLQAKSSALVDTMTAINAEKAQTASKLGELSVHKEKLKELLNLSSTENVERMKKLQQSALSFLDHSRSSTGTIRNEFGTLSTQLDTAEDNNRKMTGIYAIMTEGMKGAAQGNIAIREGLAETMSKIGEDDIIVKMQTEDKLRNLDTHSKMLHVAQGETINTYAELSQQSIRVGAMKDATAQQVDIARKLNTQGVSATADRLASVMTAVSGAAITESAGVVEHTLNVMRTKTNEITQQEVIRNAMYTDKIVNEMDSVMRELEAFREVHKVSSDMTRQGIIAMNENMTALQEQTRHLSKEIADAHAMHSELAHTGSESNSAVKEETKKASSFSF